MIIQKNKLVNSNLGSSLMSPANGLGGSRVTILFLFSFLKAAAAPALRALKQAGKKEGGWGGSVSAIPPKAEYQNRKIFFSLIEKNFGGARLKKCSENFSVLFAEAKQRRAETLGGIQSVKSSGFCSKKVRTSSNKRTKKKIRLKACFFVFRMGDLKGASRNNFSLIFIATTENFSMKNIISISIVMFHSPNGS